jgi:AcrR family transcriptional regulator
MREHRAGAPDPLVSRLQRIAGADLGDGRHLCGLFEGPDDAYARLLPVVVESLQRGERAVHIVDGALRDEHLDRLSSYGVDVSAALGSRQLDVRAWEDLYLRQEGFDPAATVAGLRDLLGEGRGLGFSSTQVIGYMDWAAGPPPVATLVAYERDVDRALGNGSDTVICAYDVERHSPGVILDIIAAHPYALVQGTLRLRAERARPRERILEVATSLFHRQGIGATGVDTLVQRAGVAKATFYRHFPSKEELVVAWLQDQRTRWFDSVREQAESSATSPQEVLPRLFDAVEEWLEADRFRGCPYLNTAAEIPDPEDRARLEAVAYLDEIRGYLVDVLEAAGSRRPEHDAARLQTVLAGGISLGAARRSTEPMRAARNAAAQLLGEVWPAQP